MSRFGSLGTQYFDNAGDPLVAGKIYFYEPGDTTTAKNTFADVGLTIANPNPVILSGAGRQPNIFFSGSARAVLTDGDNVQFEDRDPVGSDTAEGGFPTWNSDRIYNIPDIVIGSDLNFYVAITDGNSGSDPTGTPADWTQVRFIRVWNTNETYEARQIVAGSNGMLYSAVTGANQGNDPTTDTVNWTAASEASIPPVIRAAGRTYAYNNF